MEIERIERKVPSDVSLGTLVVLIGAVFGCLYQVMLLLPVPLGHDQSWYLYAAQQILSGVTLYGPHLSETNPPLIMWLSVIPVLVAHALHVSPVVALRLVVFALIILSTIWSLRFLHRRHPAASSVFLILAACAIAFVEFDIWPLDFGQREQFLVILMLPYILAVTSGVVASLSPGERCALGVAAGLAICCKPQHALIIVCLEIFLALQARTIRRMIAPEFLTFIFTGGAYVASIRLLAPLYLQKTLPLLFETYWAYGQQSALALARTQGKLILIALLVFAACFIFRKRLSNSVTPMGLVVCGLAASIAFDIQHTGWPYQRYPARAFVMLAVFYVLLDLLLPVLDRSREAPRLRIRHALIIAGLTVIPICWFAVHFYKPPAKAHSSLDDLLPSYSPHTNVSILSTNVYEFSRVFDHGLTWGSRFPALWMLPAIVQNEQSPTSLSTSAKKIDPAELSRLADLQRSQTAEDLDYWRPSVILVARCTVKDPCQALEGRNFDMLAWFLQSPAFTGVWSHYQRQQSLSAYDVYTRTQ